MPFLIDGNNLLHALRKMEGELSRGDLCEMLTKLTALDRRVAIFFDGVPPPGYSTEPTFEHGLEIAFSGPDRSADDLILARIASDTAPRRLTVVSTDRQIRKAARKRRCKPIFSEDFAEFLQRLIEKMQGRPPSEPPEKRHGLTPEQTEHWLRQFGLDR